MTKKEAIDTLDEIIVEAKDGGYSNEDLTEALISVAESFRVYIEQDKSFPG